MRRLVRDRDVRLLLAGESLSMFGDRAMFLVLGIWARSLTGSNAAAGLVFFAFSAPFLLAPLSGLLVDRVRRRPLMIVVDCAIGAAMFLLLLVHSRSDVWLLYVVAALYGLAASVFASAQSALLTVMVPDERLGEVNAAFQTFREGMRLVAPLAGAGLYAAAGGATVAALDASTFAASAVALSLLGTREREPVPPTHRFRAELAAGVRHIWGTLPLKQIVGATAVALLVIGFSETLIFAVLSQGLHRSPSFFGVLSALQGVGAVGGGLVAARVLGALGDGRLLGVGLACFGASCGLLAVPSLAVVAVAMLLAGAGISWAIVAFGTAIQRRSPGSLQGRVYSAADALVGTPQTLSIALGAGLSTLFDYRILFVVMALVTTACALYLLTRRTFLDALPAGVADGRAEPAAGLALPGSGR
jgi:MFS family permease